MTAQNPTLPADVRAVLETWYGPLDAADYPAAKQALWWGKSADTDAELTNQFGSLLASADSTDFAAWKQTPRGKVAFILLLDQFSRNIHRDSPAMYARDADAVDACLDLLLTQQDKELATRERVFAYMPLMHVENASLQRLAVRLFAELASDAPARLAAELDGYADYSVKHQVIVERFGRFPHRNSILNRLSTDEEIEFLKQPGSSF
jgi:uncharacterized protein (DUF924 family)